LLISKSNAASLEEKLNELNRLEQALQTRIAESNQLELRAESLQREIAIARENYQSYAKKLEDSRINAEQDKLVALSNISVVTPPVIRQKPVSPRRSLLAMAALVFSVLTGVVAALIGDFTSRGRELRGEEQQTGEATSASRRQRTNRRSNKVAEKEKLEPVAGMNETERPAVPR
jgi:uncharacterized protein involved in exopolysaccharide biosynthesis